MRENFVTYKLVRLIILLVVNCFNVSLVIDRNVTKLNLNHLTFFTVRYEVISREKLFFFRTFECCDISCN